LAGDDQSTEEIIRRIIPELRKGYLRASHDLNREGKKGRWKGWMNSTTVFPKSSSMNERALAVYAMVSVPWRITNASKVA